MQLGLIQLLIAISLVPHAAALQTIYFGIIGSSAGPGECIAWFSDSDPCADGATGFGYAYCAGNFCNEDITILGHPNITFTGCHPITSQSTPDYLPKGVSDDGVPALKCKPASNPPGSLYGADATCEPDEGNPNAGFVNIYSYCS
ncbi:MAG: hypothetical protein ALECFALPRED_003222 [Alectoria fallacina]|uniref:Uncharacterized protein n=1 Tax=Alectoria fallacina TaxID=1903189 RepID=A0A8H3FR85_9LECA|nr:MAG: hypothetical protein ALECFALPRED_003222 [Alectoria fallacina]